MLGDEECFIVGAGVWGGAGVGGLDGNGRLWRCSNVRDDMGAV